ncbi:hypothetical protein [Bradyrhizobium sp. SZCCHNPS2010]|uniref:hypothetical protein n=1 Tax=Bradyrhizobium sp. SZCCHNPS2010 TaxID=3057333 RepID=UPI002916B502|nr:hypothetical protein [Bradyrhizobium sp. SZCCHNPS2010]
MTTQKRLHSKAVRHIRELDEIIDKLKDAGPCQLDGDNAMLNVKDRLVYLAQRCGNQSTSQRPTMPTDSRKPDRVSLARFFPMPDQGD